MEEIIVNGERYVKASTKPSGTRAVVVVDRGWIWAGDVVQEDGFIRLENAVWVFRWEEIGFNGVIDNPKSDRVDLRRMDNPVEIPNGSVIFRIPVTDNWGL